MSLTHRQYVLSLYREILRGARCFPSVKREHVYQDIRQEFRRQKELTDDKKIEEQLLIAEQGLQIVQQYRSLTPSTPNWSIQL
jgi:hypothetical protein